MQTTHYEVLCEKILKLDHRLRAAALVDISGDKLAIKIRQDVVDKKLMPLGSMPRWGHLLAIVPWTAAENLERFFGKANEAIFRFEKIDLCLMRIKDSDSVLKDKFLVLTIEKETRIIELLDEIGKIVKSSG